MTMDTNLHFYGVNVHRDPQSLSNSTQKHVFVVLSKAVEIILLQVSAPIPKVSDSELLASRKINFQLYDEFIAFST